MLVIHSNIPIDIHSDSLVSRMRAESPANGIELRYQVNPMRSSPVESSLPPQSVEKFNEEKQQDVQQQQH